jgi:hypothetical protein
VPFDKRRRTILTLQDTYQARLDELVEKKAKLGYSADPSITLEIEDIERELSENSAVLHALNTVNELITSENKRLNDPRQPQPLEDRRDNDNQYKAMVATIEATVAQISTVKTEMSKGFADAKEDFNSFKSDVKDEFKQVYIIMAIAFGALLLVMLFK